MSPCATVFATAELCAYIVDFLHDSVEDLKSCAVVSPAFTYSAQSHLFYEIDLGKLESSTPQDEDAYARFRECLDVSPHLCSFVQRLAVQLDADLLAYFIGLPLPRLNTLSLFGGYAFYVDAGASIAAQYLLSLPSLHTLIVDACFQESTVLDLLFARCTPTLRTLGFRYVNVKSVASLGKPVSAPKPQIKELRLVHVTRGVTAWLRTPQCPVDVEHIQSLAIYMAIDRELHPLIQAASTTIEELRVHTGA
ncbi:hypothetical protein C8R46DRAFT_604748 [Mycena filopes]|nr:hypothetical protein C8R46DRAFT_604748 [Mycena filopes]